MSYSDCLSDLLCGEESSDIFSGESPGCSTGLESHDFVEESSIANFIEDERNFVPGFDYLSRFQSQSLDASAREESVAWILKVKKKLYIFLIFYYHNDTISYLPTALKRSVPSSSSVRVTSSSVRVTSHLSTVG